MLLVALAVAVVAGWACATSTDSSYPFGDDSPALTPDQPFDLSADTKVIASPETEVETETYPPLTSEADRTPPDTTIEPTPTKDLANVRDISVDPREFRQLLPRDAIFPIYDPQFISVLEAGLADDELVIGVNLNGESKAYPVGPLTRREMVNDVVGGVPVLVTW